MSGEPCAASDKRSEDEVREAVLRCLYEAHRSARSPKKARMKIRAIKNDLKQRGLTEREIVRSLDYLIQTGWILKETEAYPIPGSITGTLNVYQDYYKISDKGIDHFEGASVFQKTHTPTGINVTNIQGVTVVGDNNIVNAKYGDLFRSLELLSEETMKSDRIPDIEKLNYYAEINTIKSQLSKSQPDKSIISRAWDKLKSLATIAGIAEFFEKARTLIRLAIGI